MMKLGRPKKGSVYRKFGHWWYSWWDSGGKRHFKNSHSTIKQDAIDLLDQKREESKRGISADVGIRGVAPDDGRSLEARIAGA